jgi:hypothetical protein
MPLSLVLHATFTTWHRDLTRWNAWNKIVDLEETLLERARGAFLARWFGAGLPTAQNTLLVFIANLDELRTRYREQRREALSSDSDRNLTEPFAGIVGTLAGAFLSPTSSILLMPAIANDMPSVATKLAAAVNTMTWGGLGAVFAAVGVPLVGLGLPYKALTQPDLAAAAFRFLGTLAGFFMATRDLIEELLAPREDVHNWLLRKLLNLLDHAARLFPFLFVLAVLVIFWAGPRLRPLAFFLERLITVAVDLFKILGDALSDFFERLQDLVAGENSPWTIVSRIGSAFKAWLGWIGRLIGGLVGAGEALFETVPIPQAPGETGEPRRELRIWRDLKEAFAKVLPLIEKLTSESWFVLRFNEIGTRFSRIITIFMGAEPSPPKPKGFVDKIVDFELDQLKALAPEWPDTLKWPESPQIGEFPSAETIFNKEKRIADLSRDQSSRVLEEAFRKPEPREGYVFNLDKDAQKALDKIRRPPEDVFTQERKALLASPELEGKSLKNYLEDARKLEASLRSSLFAVLDGVLPELAAQHVPHLQDLFWELDSRLYDRLPDKSANFPVRDQPGGDLLNVKVGHVRVRAPGRNKQVVREWGKDLMISLQKQVYRTGAPGAT